MRKTIVDNLKEYVLKSEDLADKALATMALDIERLSKAQVPVGPMKSQNKNSKGSGQLKSSGRTERIGPLKYRVQYNKEYALFQHEGGDAKRKVRNYTKPGSKKHFLIDPAKSIVANAIRYFKNQFEQL